MQEKVQEKELQQQLVLLPPSLHPFFPLCGISGSFYKYSKNINLWPWKPRY